MTQEEIDALLKRVESNALQKGDYEIIKFMTEAIMTLGQALDNKAASIKRLLAMLFGPKTEKKDNVLKENEPEQTEPKKKDKKPPKAKPEKKKKGHGKIPASNYTEADQKFISHEKFKQKGSCPLCLTGKLYPMKKPGIAIYLKGQPPIDATIYNLEKLRCNLCGEVFTAGAPDGITGKHYDETAKAMMAVLKYGYGFPWYRLEKLQESLGIPLPASTQWEKIESQADLIYPAFDELKRQAAQGKVPHNDDTTMKILDLIQENKTRDKDERTGIFTSGEECNLFFRFVANRYEKTSTIITSNKAFTDWTELFHDPIIVTAILDRLLHHSAVINIKGNSYRLKEKMEQKDKGYL